MINNGLEAQVHETKPNWGAQSLETIKSFRGFCKIAISFRELMAGTGQKVVQIMLNVNVIIT